MGRPSLRQRRKQFEELALPHLDAVYGTALRLTRNPAAAEDLAQEAMLRAYRFWDTFQNQSNCKAWLLKIVTNTFINQYQKEKRSREILTAAKTEQDARDGVLVQERGPEQLGPEAMLVNQSFSDDVVKALDELPQEFRVAVVLCDVQGLSYKEVAEAMECPVGTVMSRIYRGRRLLKESLKQFAQHEGFLSEDKGGDIIQLSERRNEKPGSAG
jgi:RNA polymerase sigma-70 factor (ECF subfamily)